MQATHKLIKRASVLRGESRPVLHRSGDLDSIFLQNLGRKEFNGLVDSRHTTIAAGDDLFLFAGWGGMMRWVGAGDDILIL
ncbi:hypothetical protein Ddc_16600 [Ditylenchus destructor]|nr:hypothetical protein Ddc_16600 [Ditylenchus destructor]